MPRNKEMSEAEVVLKLLKEDLYSYCRPSNLILVEFGEVLVHLDNKINKIDKMLTLHMENTVSHNGE